MCTVTWSSPRHATADTVAHPVAAGRLSPHRLSRGRRRHTHRTRRTGGRPPAGPTPVSAGGADHRLEPAFPPDAAGLERTHAAPVGAGGPAVSRPAGQRRRTWLDGGSPPGPDARRSGRCSGPQVPPKRVCDTAARATRLPELALITRPGVAQPQRPSVALWAAWVTQAAHISCGGITNSSTPGFQADGAAMNSRQQHPP